jgi:hypothetical protein
MHSLSLLCLSGPSEEWHVGDRQCGRCIHSAQEMNTGLEMTDIRGLSMTGANVPEVF